MNAFVTSAPERRKRSREARDAFPAMGIYAIRNLASGKVRLGSSRNVHGTINRIRFELRLGTHPDKKLQADWKLDPSAFVFEVLDLVEERTDPGFDYSAELRALEEIHRSELRAEGTDGPR